MFDNEKTGSYGTTMLDGDKLPIKWWEVSPTDESIIGDFGHKLNAAVPLFNVILHIDVKKLGQAATSILAKPVERTMVDGGLQMLPNIIFATTKLFQQEVDPRPLVEFDRLKVISGPNVAANNMLVQVCYNLTAAKYDPQIEQRKNSRPLAGKAERMWEKGDDFIALELVDNMYFVSSSEAYRPTELVASVAESDKAGVQKMNADLEKWADKKGMKETKP